MSKRKTIDLTNSEIRLLIKATEAAMPNDIRMAVLRDRLKALQARRTT